jgi:hypothetical protein
MSAFNRGLQASVRNNYAAYGYSIMITASFGVLASRESTPKLGFIFLFLAGAIAGFVIIEAIVSKGFKRAPRGEPIQVVALGAAFSFGSVGAAVGAASIATIVLDGWAVWLVGAFAASATFILMLGLEIAIAERVQDPEED